METDFASWLEAESGRSAALAKHFRVTPAAISQWKTNGVPVRHMQAVREFTAGAVSLEGMVMSKAFRVDEAKA